MIEYVVRRFLYMVLTLALVSLVAFLLIQLPPGDYLSSYIMSLQAQGQVVTEAEIDVLRQQYGLDRGIFVQYGHWISNIITKGDFGRSFAWNQPVADLVWGRIGYTALVALLAMLFTFAIAIPIGIISALRRYSLWDHLFTVIGYIGLAIPSFLLALIFLYVGLKVFGMSVGGLFSAEYADAPWSWGKLLDLLSHIWVPMIVLGLAGTAEVIRIMRSMLLDELGKQYVTTARAKGVSERRLIWKYPVRIALNPIASTVGWRLTQLISGAPIVAVVLSLPTTGPLLLNALLNQDMYLAGAFVLLLSGLTIIGTFLSDILLAALDPRIRLEK